MLSNDPEAGFRTLRSTATPSPTRNTKMPPPTTRKSSPGETGTLARRPGKKLKNQVSARLIKG
jgi:hypothetical protein